MKKMNKKGVIISIFIIFVILVISVVIYVNINKKVELKLASKVEFLESESSVVEATVLDKVEKSKNIKINGEKLELEYKQTRNNLNIYCTQDKKDEYIFKDGKLVGFLKENNVLGGGGDKKSAERIAKEFGKDNIQNFNKYEMTDESFVNSFGKYSFKYVRKIDGIDTNDTAKISVNSSGEVVSFSAINQGEFEKYKNCTIDAAGANDLCLEKIKNKYGEEIKETKIKNQYLRILNGKLVLQTDVEIFFNNTQDELIEKHEIESLICEINKKI